MKKNTSQKLLAAVLSMFIAFSLVIIPETLISHADGLMVQDVIEFSNGATYKVIPDYYEIKMPKALKGAKKVTVSSSKKSVVEAYEWTKGEKTIPFFAYKKGTATITVKVKKSSGSKTYKFKVKVVERNTPFKTIKVGSKSVKSGFKQLNYADLEMDKACKKKITVKPANGWKVKKITFEYRNLETDKTTRKTVKNGGTISFKNPQKYSNDVYIRMYNNKTKTYANFRIYVYSED